MKQRSKPINLKDHEEAMKALGKLYGAENGQKVTITDRRPGADSVYGLGEDAAKFINQGCHNPYREPSKS